MPIRIAVTFLGGPRRTAAAARPPSRSGDRRCGPGVAHLEIEEPSAPVRARDGLTIRFAARPLRFPRARPPSETSFPCHAFVAHRPVADRLQPRKSGRSRPQRAHRSNRRTVEIGRARGRRRDGFRLASPNSGKPGGVPKPGASQLGYSLHTLPSTGGWPTGLHRPETGRVGRTGGSSSGRRRLRDDIGRKQQQEKKAGGRSHLGQRRRPANGVCARIFRHCQSCPFVSQGRLSGFELLRRARVRAFSSRAWLTCFGGR